MKLVCRAMFTQMSTKQGIEKFRERAVAAMVKTFKELNDGAIEGKTVVAPVDYDSLSDRDKKQALEAVNSIKEKRCGVVWQN